MRSSERQFEQRFFGDVDGGQGGLGDFLILVVHDADFSQPEFEAPIARKSQNGVADAQTVALKLGVELFFNRRHQEGERDRPGKKAHIKSGDGGERDHAIAAVARLPNRIEWREAVLTCEGIAFEMTLPPWDKRASCTSTENGLANARLRFTGTSARLSFGGNRHPWQFAKPAAAGSSEPGPTAFGARR